MASELYDIKQVSCREHVSLGCWEVDSMHVLLHGHDAVGCDPFKRLTASHIATHGSIVTYKS